MKNLTLQEAEHQYLRIRSDRSTSTIDVSGHWVMSQHDAIIEAITLAHLAISISTRELYIDCSALKGMDTSGALQLRQFFVSLNINTDTVKWVNIPANIAPLLKAVLKADIEAVKSDAPTIGWSEYIFMPIGKAITSGYEDCKQILGFLGALLVIFYDILRGKVPFRYTSMIYHIEQAGLKAVPIMALMSFLIGAIIAQQGAYQLRRFGADVLVVNLVGVLILREMGVLLTAIMFAGRSGSAFTAEIGAMKMREEIDALNVMGRDPISVLVMPRLCALIISLPLLTVISNFFALFGAMLVSWFYSGIEPSAFIAQLREAIGMNTFITGLAKAPFMALIIGIIACIEGLKVAGSTDSLGRQTTQSVVKSIFLVIVLDGIFAMIVAKMNW